MRKKEPPENFLEYQHRRTTRQIMDECGVCSTTVSKWLRKAGVPRGKGKRRNKKVFAFDPKTGAFVKEYPSVKEAAAGEFVTSGAISAALNGRTKTAAGYRWEYAEAWGEE